MLDGVNLERQELQITPAMNENRAPGRAIAIYFGPPRGFVDDFLNSIYRRTGPNRATDRSKVNDAQLMPTEQLNRQSAAQLLSTSRLESVQTDLNTWRRIAENTVL